MTVIPTKIIQIFIVTNRFSHSRSHRSLFPYTLLRHLLMYFFFEGLSLRNLDITVVCNKLFQGMIVYFAEEIFAQAKALLRFVKEFW
jgi:hypothetical protein